MLKRNCVLGAALFAFALLGSQIARADDEKPVNLIVAPKAGRVTRAKMVMKANVMGMDLVVSSIRKDTIKEVKENGDFVVELVDEGGTVNIGGQENDAPIAPPQTIVRDKVSKVKEIKDAPPNPYIEPEIAQIMTELATAILTDKPVKAKDTWQTELDNPKVKAKKIMVKGTYLGPDKIDGKDYWKIKQTAEAVVDANGSKLNYEVTQWIDPTDGTTFKTEGTLTDVPTSAGLLTMQITGNAVKADDKAKSGAAKP